MAFGQIDPARLEGDALKNWYLRSPSQIEEERQQAAVRAYDNFFTPVDNGSQTDPEPAADTGASGLPDKTGLVWSQVGDNRWRSERVPAEPSPSLASSSRFDHGYQLAAAASAPARDYWSIPGCANCHGYRPGTLPPIGGPSPFPPGFNPRAGGAGGQSPAPRRDSYPQCEMQDRNDRGICYQQPTPKAKAVCNESATERHVWCDEHEGEIGHPPLATARRKSGRPWP